MQKIIFSGVQPSGNLHLGNYLGAIKNWVNLQNEYKCIFCVVDYHAITVKQDPLILKKKNIEIAKLYLASGINPENALIFQQSAVSAHTELAWILNTITKVSELERMTQFKDKALTNKRNINMGLFDYPVLMAADILLYNTDVVPVGEDQKQHLELARELAKRFNTQFIYTFKIPNAYIAPQGARIMGLDDPNKKMSKSASSASNYIALLDKPDVAAKKIMKAVTDTGTEIIYDTKHKPAIANLLTIYSLLSNISIQNLEKQYQDKGYGVFKKDLVELVVNFLHDFQNKYYSFDDKFVTNMLAKNNKKADALAQEKLTKVKKAIGIL